MSGFLKVSSRNIITDSMEYFLTCFLFTYMTFQLDIQDSYSTTHSGFFALKKDLIKSSYITLN
jgi:hypothetical protein